MPGLIAKEDTNSPWRTSLPTSHPHLIFPKPSKMYWWGLDRVSSDENQNSRDDELRDIPVSLDRQQIHSDSQRHAQDFRIRHSCCQSCSRIQESRARGGKSETRSIGQQRSATTQLASGSSGTHGTVARVRAEQASSMQVQFALTRQRRTGDLRAPEPQPASNCHDPESGKYSTT